MYTILLNDTNELITSVKERIMQRSKLVDNLHFLVDPIYKGIDMTDFTVMMEYILPVSREYKSEVLVKSDELYKEKQRKINIENGYAPDYDAEIEEEIQRRTQEMIDKINKVL